MWLICPEVTEIDLFELTGSLAGLRDQVPFDKNRTSKGVGGRVLLSRLNGKTMGFVDYS
jgi:hypothetical protein